VEILAHILNARLPVAHFNAAGIQVERTAVVAHFAFGGYIQLQITKVLVVAIAFDVAAHQLGGGLGGHAALFGQYGLGLVVGLYLVALGGYTKVVTLARAGAAFPQGFFVQLNAVFFNIAGDNRALGAVTNRQALALPVSGGGIEP